MACAMRFQSSQSQASENHPKGRKKKVICLLAFILLSIGPMTEDKCSF